MSVGSSQDTKDQVRQAIDIVDLVGQYIPLRRQGQRYVGLCPWHDDSRPSLQVNPDRQSFKCWVCDVGGDVFSFLMRAEGIEFREALEMLAERAGISLVTRRSDRPLDPADDKQMLYRAMAWAEDQYHRYLLDAPAAAPAREYLADRGITADSIATWRLGYAPHEWEWILGRAHDSPFAAKVLEAVGLVVPRKEGAGHYDRFRGRVLFSIRDVGARPIAFGGRILPQFADEATAKYINSSESKVFSKSDQLYGLDQARASLAKEGNVVVVEGYTDCIMAHQCGVTNVVAVLGTALGERHIRLLNRYTDSVVLVLDGDEAGQRRAGAILELFIAMQAELKILTLPQDLDPCDFLMQHGSEAFGRMLSQALDALEHKIRMVTKGLDLTADTHRANVALEEILGTLAKAPALATGANTAMRLREGQVLARLSREFGLTEPVLRDRLKSLRRKSSSSQRGSRHTAEPPAAAPLQLDPWDRELLELLLQRPDLVTRIGESISVAELRHPAARELFTLCLQLDMQGVEPDFDRLMLELDDSQLKNLLVTLDETSQAKSESDVDVRLEETLASFRRRREDVETGTKIAAMRDNTDERSQAEALDTLMTKLKARHTNSEPKDG